MYEGTIPAILIVAAYFLPGIVASLRGHHNAGAIWLTSLLLGWTGLGWIAALIWSATAVRPEPVNVRLNVNGRDRYVGSIEKPSKAFRELAGLK